MGDPHTDDHRRWWHDPSYEYRADLIAEDDRGDLWVASRAERRKPWPRFDIPFRRWDPRCWGAWRRSARLGAIMMVEVTDERR